MALWAAALAAAAWSLRAARGQELIAATREQAQAQFRGIPAADFAKDRANRFRGTVLDARGRALPGAQVEIYDVQELLQAAAAAPPGRWPEPQPERRGTCDGAGGYEFRDLSYGGKLAVFRHPGYAAHLVSAISFADGYGADAVDGALTAIEPRELLLQDESGRPIAGEELRFLPRGWGLPAASTRSDARGRASIPEEVRCSAGSPRLLAGSPPLLVEWEAGAAPVVRLPEARDLELRCEGAGSGALTLQFLPQGARRAGFHRVELDLQEGRARLAGIRRGAWEVLAEHPASGRLAYARLSPEADFLSLVFQEPRDLRLKVLDPDGAELPAQAAWQAAPLAAVEPFADQDPFPWSEGEEPTRIWAPAAPEGQPAGVLVFSGLPPADGWLLVQAEGYVPLVTALGAGQRELEVRLEPAVEVTLRTQRPYLPVQVEIAGQPPQWGRSDAAAEVFLWAPPGPLVARAAFTGKGRSYPKGCWAGRGAASLEFSLLDDRGRPRGCVYGFVTDAAGNPVERANVVLQGGDGRPVMESSDAHGFFRFTGLQTGPYLIFARPEDYAGAAWELSTTVLEEVNGVNGFEEGEQRFDLRVWPGAVEFAALPGAAATEYQLWRGDQIYWRTLAEEDGQVRVANLPPGDYEVRADGVRGTLGRFAVTAETAGVVRLEAREP